MKHPKIIPISIGLIATTLLLVVAFNFPQKTETVDCAPLKKKFDEYFIESTRIIDDPIGLCYGITMGTDFSSLTPKWAVGELTAVKKESGYSSEFLEFSSILEFRGLEKTLTMPISYTKKKRGYYEVGHHYKIDMNNICRFLFMPLDSRYPSPIASTFVQPEKVSCK